MKIPGPDHLIEIAPARKRVRVVWRGRSVADTTRALQLAEATYPPVFYIPRADADMALLSRNDHTTHCPYKGDASYFGLAADGARQDNAAWSYEAPFAAVAAIKDHLAFYPDRVDKIEITD